MRYSYRNCGLGQAAAPTPAPPAPMTAGIVNPSLLTGFGGLATVAVGFLAVSMFLKKKQSA